MAERKSHDKIDTFSQPRVIIVGAGPTGLSLALLLERAGIHTALIERNRRPQQHPAACILNARTMEVFRELGVAAEILEQAQDVLERANITWVTTLAGRELGQCSVLPDDLASLLAASPVHATHFPQNRLEPLLWERVNNSRLVDFYPGHECREITQAEGSVNVRAVETESSTPLLLDAPFMVACDGASSPTRRTLGISSDGPVLQNIIGMYFTADLGELIDHRKSILYWILNEQLIGVLIAQWLPNEWVLFAPFFPPQQTLADFSDEECHRLIRAAIGYVPDDLQVKLVRPWVLAAKLADRYRQEGVFLAGDAAHSFPPTGGLGLNTGVQDAHNLAWKLSAVLNGSAGAELLDTYEPERRPTAQANLEHSVTNYENMNELTNVVGLDLKSLRTLRRIQHSRTFRLLPLNWQKSLVQRAVDFAVGRLSELNLEGAQGESVRNEFRSRIPSQAPHYKFSGMDLGFAYRQGAVLSEASEQPMGKDSVIDYRPTTWPGARLPHCWVEREGQRISVHDVLKPDTVTIFTFPDGHKTWSEALAALRDSFAMPVECLSIGFSADCDLRDLDNVWAELSEIKPSGVIVVRPDGHVAARSRSMPPDPIKWLRTVFRVLCQVVVLGEHTLQ